MAYRDSTTAGGTGTTFSVAVPAGAATNDIALLKATFDGNSGVFEAADWPTGFTELGEVVLNLDGQTVAWAWKRLTGADSGSYASGTIDTTHDWIAQCILLSGRHLTDPPVMSTVASSSAANGSPVTVTANGVTAVLGDDLVWGGDMDINVVDAGTGFTPPSGYTEAEDAEFGWSTGSWAYKENVSAGATGTVAGTCTLASGAAGWAAVLIRVPSGSSDVSVPLTGVFATGSVGNVSVPIISTADIFCYVSE